MKLQDLAAPQKTQQVAKVMESYFGNSLAFDQLKPQQAQAMLTRVRELIAEQRRQPSFHQSEQNPAYLKLLMMEQGLAAAAMPGQTASQSAAQQSAMIAQRKKQNQDKIKANNETIKMLQQQNQQLQQSMNSPVGESKRARKLREASEVQQAQVVLASKDMVDQVQKMIEQTTAIQFKDLPALVDQIRNEVGYDVATQFNSDATTALSGLVQNLQASKAQLEQALGVVTGQAPTVPGADMAPAPAEMPAPAAGEEEIDIDSEEEIEEPASDLETSLGRAKR